MSQENHKVRQAQFVLYKQFETVLRKETQLVAMDQFDLLHQLIEEKNQLMFKLNQLESYRKALPNVREESPVRADILAQLKLLKDLEDTNRAQLEIKMMALRNEMVTFDKQKKMAGKFKQLQGYLSQNKHSGFEAKI